jgi:hypothetical protein
MFRLSEWSLATAIQLPQITKIVVAQLKWWVTAVGAEVDGLRGHVLSFNISSPRALAALLHTK